MVYVNEKVFNDLLESLSVLTKAKVSLWDEHFHDTAGHSRPGDSVCEKVKLVGKAKCAECDFAALDHCSKTGQPYCYHCHFGFIEIAIPAPMNSRVCSYIQLGPFRDPKTKKADEARISEFARKYGFNETVLLRQYRATPRFTEDKLSAIEDLIKTIVYYSKGQKWIGVKEDIFDSSIEPFITERLSDKRVLAEAREAFGLSEKQLQAAVRAATGLSPKRYLTKRRIDLACEKLSFTDMPLKELCAGVGYDDYNYFIKVFKAEMGCTPLRYRKTHSANR
jgi:AraC-like DNA-binding protein